jgi:hypothetical protein
MGSGVGVVPPPLDVIVQAKEVWFDGPLLSLAVTITSALTACVGVPVIQPVVELSESPGGSPDGL